ncbi:unnamed protein product [Protopolystoma xenopodis]|uniref:Cadherin domain-containing protein n=1 Tax=Protopolystoma xenopodis TaxID=117903 RepID=A0A3S5CUT3_9PLAT|nr:unnamed protein product [Protopolystoma xenopodis]
MSILWIVGLDRSSYLPFLPPFQLTVSDRDTLDVNGHLECVEPAGLAGRQTLLFEPLTIVPPQLLLSETSSSETGWSTANGYAASTGHGLGTGLMSAAGLGANGRPARVPQLQFQLVTRDTLDLEDGGPPVRLSYLTCCDGAPAASPDTSATDLAVWPSKLCGQPGSTTARFSATFTVSLTVLDQNDNRPVFQETVYPATVMENLAAMTKVIKVGENCLFFTFVSFAFCQNDNFTLKQYCLFSY